MARGRTRNGPAVRAARGALLFVTAVAAAPGEDEAGRETPPEEIRSQAMELASRGDYEPALLLIEKALDMSGHDPGFLADHITILAWSGGCEEAVRLFEGFPADVRLPVRTIQAVAACCRRLEQFEKAEALYRSLLREKPRDADASAGLALTLLAAGNTDEALRVLGPTVADRPNNPELLFALAATYRAAGEHTAALRVCDRLLELTPSSAEAAGLKIRLLLDIGAASLALDFATSHEAQVDPELIDEAGRRLAAQHVRWDEAEAAVRILNTLIAEEPTPMRRIEARFDRILALHRLQNTAQATAAYQELVEHGVRIPDRVREAAADMLSRPEARSSGSRR